MMKSSSTRTSPRTSGSAPARNFGSVPTRNSGSVPGNGGRAKPLSLTDLEIPVKPLLTREQEVSSGSKVRQSLKRLAEFLPRHPLGYRRFLSRMSEVTEGGTLMFSWLSLKERMERDLIRATRALSRSESLAPKDTRGALAAYERGIVVLKTYPLDPETVYQWAREVCSSQRALGPLGKLRHVRKSVRLLKRTLAVLEKEREKMVLPNFRLVLKEVFRYHPTGMRRSDLFQEGILGLQKAVFRFDATRGIRFSTYATYWIRQSIRKALIDKSRMIRVPQAIQEELRKEETAMKESEAIRVRRILSETVLFSAGESDSADDRFSFDVRDAGPSAELSHALHIGRIPRAVSEALSELTTRERDVVQRRFGLAGERPQTLEEIGNHLNLSRERIRQIEREALERMRRFQELMEIYEDLDLVENANVVVRS